MVAHAFKPLIPALGRQRQADLSEFKASLVYNGSSRTARTVTQRNPVSKKQKEYINTTASMALHFVEDLKTACP